MQDLTSQSSVARKSSLMQCYPMSMGK